MHWYWWVVLYLVTGGFLCCVRVMWLKLIDAPIEIIPTPDLFVFLLVCWSLTWPLAVIYYVFWLLWSAAVGFLEMIKWPR